MKDGEGAESATAARGAEIDIAFLDPPYEDEDAYAVILEMLGGASASALAIDAIVVAEHRYKRPLLEAYGALVRYRVLKQGDAALSFYRLRVGE